MDLSLCRDVCAKCHLLCAQAAVHVLVKGQPHPRDLVRALWDCSDICITAANLLTRGSPHHGVTCGACAEICDACADACGATADAILRGCADACRECARLCREMAAHR